MFQARRIAFAALSLCLLPARAAASSQVALPSPSSSFGVSRTTYDWVDSSRRETASENQNDKRELLVFVWYPTEKKQIGNPAAYLPGADKIDRNRDSDDVKNFWGTAWPRIVSGQVVSETSHQSKIVPGSQKFPLLIFSPGLGISSTAYTTMIQEVVSRGYIVVSVEPTFEVGGVVFPDGRVVTEKPEATGRGPSPPGETKEQFLKRLHDFDAGHIQKWADDIRFVVDQITMENISNKPNAAPFAGRVDLTKIAAWGHSFGGRAAGRACQIDQRIKACLDLDGLGPDGPIFAYIGTPLPKQPFMWMEVFHEPPTDAQLAPFKMTRNDWEKDHEQQLVRNEQELKQCSGGSYHVLISFPGIEHYSFTDQPFITAETKEESKKAVHALEVINQLIGDFFDKYLKDSGGSMLDSPAHQDGVSIERFNHERTGMSAPH